METWDSAGDNLQLQSHYSASAGVLSIQTTAHNGVSVSASGPGLNNDGYYVSPDGTITLNQDFSNSGSFTLTESSTGYTCHGSISNTNLLLSHTRGGASLSQTIDLMTITTLSDSRVTLSNRSTESLHCVMVAAEAVAAILAIYAIAAAAIEAACATVVLCGLAMFAIDAAASEAVDAVKKSIIHGQGC